MTDYQPMIRDLPPDQRPRERLLSAGPASLSDADLLALLLRSGTRQESVVRVAERLIVQFKSLKGLAQANTSELVSIKGIGEAKAAELQAALELGKRLAAFSEAPRPQVRTPEDVYHLVGTELRYLSQEQFRTLCLDTRGGVIRARMITQGSLNSSIVEAREVFREAISCSAASIVAVHNHPSGDPTPSPEDVTLTKRLVEAGKLLGIELVDHVVVGDGRWVSLRQRGLM